jgi:hypothetical protein
VLGLRIVIEFGISREDDEGNDKILYQNTISLFDFGGFFSALISQEFSSMDHTNKTIIILLLLVSRSPFQLLLVSGR